ncbi:hypothetical protein [Micromonospora chersina]|uniref:hypothetical protein n=1 Tax=Micromonospora chersina TaxID=47854 RepID=UPI003D8EDABF
MGVRLIVEVLDHAPPGLTAGDRLLLVVLAENANDETREGWPGWELIARRMRWADQRDGGKNAVSTALANLARRGVECRVPIGQTEAGRPVFAAHGRRTTYRIPHLRRVAETPTLEGLVRVPPINAEGWQSSGTKGGNPGGRRVAESATPSPQEPSGNPQQQAQPSTQWRGKQPTTGPVISSDGSPLETGGAVSMVTRHTGCTPGEAAAALTLIQQERQPRNLSAFVRTLADAGDLAPYIERARAQQGRQVVAQWIAALASQPACEHGQAGGNQHRPDTNEPHCALCRARHRRTAA